MSDWIFVAKADQIDEGCAVPFDVQGQQIALVNVEGQIYAVDDTCSHADASLCEGMVDDYELECPLHFARFDVRTGAATCSPATKPIRSYQVRISDGAVEIKL